MFLFITFCILLIGIVNAADVESNDTTDVTPAISEKTTETVDTVTDIKKDVINENINDIKKKLKRNPLRVMVKYKLKYL